MTDQQKARIKVIRARLEEATLGPWKFNGSYLLTDPVTPLCPLAGGFPVSADGDFCAHSRQDIPFLLELVAELDVATLEIK